MTETRFVDGLTKALSIVELRLILKRECELRKISGDSFEWDLSLARALEAALIAKATGSAT